MSDWRIQHHYGFGAGRVLLHPQPHLGADRTLSFVGAIREVGGDFYLTVLPPLLLAAFVCSALFLTVSKDRGYTDLEVAMIGRVAVELAEEAPPPPPTIAEPVPEPPPEVKVVEKKPEPPPPVIEKKPVVEKPAPLPPVKRIAAAKPKPKPRVVPKPVAKPKPAPPRPQIDALAKAPALASPPPAPARRGNRVREKVRPKLAALAPVASVPSLKPADESNRSRRFAAVRAAAPSGRPRADLGPPIAARPLSAPEPAPPPARTRRAAPRTAAEKRSAARVSFAAVAPTTAPREERAASRRSRPVGQRDRSRRAPAPKIELALTAAAPASLSTALPNAPRRTVDRDRTERNASTRSRSDHTGSRSLAGVPLASLAACVSDREEDALKRKLVAAVTTQRECASRAGTYRFVETKNLNAFLMTIERVAGRSVGDRCAELARALECVAR